MEWEQVARRSDLIGKTLTLREFDTKFRGIVTAITIEGSSVYFDLAGVERAPRNSDNWQHELDNDTYMCELGTPVHGSGDGIRFYMTGLGAVTIE